MGDPSGVPATLIPGRPSRVVMATPDRAGTIAFYGALLGWTPPGGNEGLDFFQLGGRPVAGLFELPPAAVEHGAASRWLVYVTVRGIGSALQQVVPSGGQVLAQAFDLPDGGRMAIVADPSGAEVGLWQPPETADPPPEGPGSLAWAELYTRSKAQAAGFYEKVFGWEVQDVRSGDDAYMVATLHDEPVAGVMPIGANAGDMPSYWMPYFAVTDAEVAVSEAVSLGGEVCAPPEDLPAGRLAVLRDPYGALFFIVEERPD